MGTSWLQESPERAVIEARVAYYRAAAIQQDLHDMVDTMMAAIRAGGYEPVINLDNIETIGPDTAPAARG